MLAVNPGSVSVRSGGDDLLVVRLFPFGFPVFGCFDVDNGFPGDWWIARPLVNRMLLDLMTLRVSSHSSPECHWT